MLKLITETSLPDNEISKLYTFIFTEADLNRLERDGEIFFSFEYAGHSGLYGLIVYVPEFETIDTPEHIYKQAIIDKVAQAFAYHLDYGSPAKILRVFPLAKSVLQKMRDTPYWKFNTETYVTSPSDRQVFFAGKDHMDIARTLFKVGFTLKEGKRTSIKGKFIL